MTKKREAVFIKGPIAQTLLKATFPMMLGLFGMFAFNLVDTFFVSKLGVKELAALTFTFPVIMVIASLALGMGVGASALISKALGEGDHYKVERVATDGLLLAVVMVAVLAGVGLATIKPVFSALGATPEIIVLIEQYMKIWYMGVVFVVVPMFGNNAIRALGDIVTPSVIMLIAVFVNVIIDPLLIFGIGPFPKMGLAGAAIATILARAVTFVVSFYILYKREKIITFKLPRAEELIRSWKQVIYLGLPTAGTRMIMPLALAVVTRMIASFGAASVAAFGVATRIEMFAMTLIFSLAVVLGPFIGQNWGAGLIDRVRGGIKFSKRVCLIWGAIVFVFFAVFARPIASVFNGDPEVVDKVVFFLRTVPLGYGALGVLIISASSLIVLHKPFHSAALMLIQMFVFYVPLAFLGGRFWGVPGIFASFAVSYLASGVIANYVLNKDERAAEIRYN